jgi:hypothetical protein
MERSVIMRKKMAIAASLIGLTACTTFGAGIPSPAAAQAAAPETSGANQALLKSVIEALQQGKPGFSQMEPTLEQTIRQQGVAALQQLGALKTITFLGEQSGNGIYKVEFQNGATLWAIRMSQNGKIAGLSFRPM